MYDFDKTLSPKDMQEFSFIPSLGIEPAQFWSEVTALAESQKMDGILELKEKIEALVAMLKQNKA